MKPETFKKYVKFIDDLKDGKPRIELKGVASAFISWLISFGYIRKAAGGSYILMSKSCDSKSVVALYKNEMSFKATQMRAEPKQSIKVLSITEREIIGYILHLEQISGCKYQLIKTETITKTTVIHE